MPSNPPKAEPRYLSLSTTTVLFGTWALGLLMAQAGQLSGSVESIFLSVSTAAAIAVGAGLGGRRARGDQISPIHELLAILGIVACALLVTWVVVELRR